MSPSPVKPLFQPRLLRAAALATTEKADLALPTTDVLSCGFAFAISATVSFGAPQAEAEAVAAATGALLSEAPCILCHLSPTLALGHFSTQRRASPSTIVLC